MLNSPEEVMLNGLIDAVADRQKLLANNLTNVRTEGYVRQDMDFASVLRDLKNDGPGQKDINRSIENATYQDQNTAPDYERELSSMFENQMKYILLTRLNGHIYKHMEEATQSGRAS